MVSSLKPTIAVEVNIIDDFVESSSPRASWTSWIQSWLEELYPEIPPAEVYELSLCLTTDEEIQQLNSQYRHKDRPTDVLAFAALEVNFPQLPSTFSEMEPLYLGDIIVSVETAERQAEQQGHSLTVELAWLISHGLLHLLGWDHPDDKSLAAMLLTQEKLLKIVGILT
jgi:probable rRNA maturation factor